MSSGLTGDPLTTTLLPAATPRRSVRTVDRARLFTLAALFAVLALALGLRLWGLSFGLPYLYHADEPRKVAIATRMVKTGDLNPHYFKKPTLQIYLNAAVQGADYLVGRATGRFQSLDDLREPLSVGVGVGRTDFPEMFLLGRGVTLAFGLGGVALMFVLGRAWTGRTSVGLLAAALLAVCPAHVAFSRYIHQDALVIFFLLLTLIASLRVLRRGGWRDYLFAGVAAGLAVGSKYNALFALIPPIAAHWLQPPDRQRPDRRLFASLLAAVGAFLATSPYALIDAPTFLGGILFETIHCLVGHPGMGGNTPAWYANYLLTVEGAAAVIGIVALIACCIRAAGVRAILSPPPWGRLGGGPDYKGRSKAPLPASPKGEENPEPVRHRESLLFAAFPVLYFAVIASLPLRNEQTLLPVLPFLFLFASRWLIELGVGRAALPVKISVAALLLAWPLVRDVQAAVQLTRIDSRETARAWINAHLPAGSRIILEGYAPFVDPARFDVSSCWLMCKQSPAWFVDEGIDYVVLSEKCFGRFYAEPGHHPDEIAGYESLFAALEPVQSFNDGGYDVRILRVRRPVPEGWLGRSGP